MKTALITTTINVPKVLSLYREYGPDVWFFVAGDEKTPQAAHDFCVDMGGCTYLSPEMQRSFNYKCSELISWNCIQRRNIALLEAVKWGADFIITIDDDVIPLNNSYFSDYWGRVFNTYYKRISGEGYTSPNDVWDWEIIGPRDFNGIKVSSPTGWFDPGQILTPSIHHRGMPLGVPSTPPDLSTITDARIGVMAGLWVGDADVNATHRIANPSAVTQTNALAEAGVVVDHGTKTVWNAQNVGFIHELAPAMFQMPGIGRADDIFASLITQRIMREHDLYAHIGKPFAACWQDRSTASMIRDIEEEIFLYKYTQIFAERLDRIEVLPGSPLEQVRDIYRDLAEPVIGHQLLPKQATDAALAFLDDMEKVL